MIFETHAHYDEEEFDPDREELLSTLKDHNVGKVINVGTTVLTSRMGIEFSKKYDFIYAAVGIHPEFAEEYGDDDLSIISELADYDKVISIGEIGLDYHYSKDPMLREKQIKLFKKQLDMAILKDLPVIIHSRDAAKDTFEIMTNAADRGLRGVLHCYSYSEEQAVEYVKKGYYIGIGGALTFKNASKKVEMVKRLPIESLLLETDCPYMAPEPVRGSRNYSGNLVYVAQKIADIKDMSLNAVIEQTEKNAEDLFF
jgi:TatD DNase family protein